MSQTLPLPLSQQILAWLIQALGYENAPGQKMQISSSTRKNALRGAVIARSWDVLVEDVSRMLGLAPGAPDLLRGLLRRWDASVSSRRAPPLEVRDALLPVLRLAAPRIGVRLGVAAALVAQATGGSADEWEWLCDPLDPRFFRRVLDRVFARYRPEFKTWIARFESLPSGTFDERTAARWNQGEVPGPQIIESVIAAIDPGSEMPLRWARAMMALRRDLEAWVGSAAVDSWREAVRGFATSTLNTFTDPRAVPRIAELWAEEVAQATTPEISALLANLARMAGVETRPDNTAPWLQRAAAAGYGGRSPTAAETRAVLLLTILQPHGRLLSAAMERHGASHAKALASADLWQWLDREWAMLPLLRLFTDGEPLRLQRPDESESMEVVPDEVRGAARILIGEAASFVRSHDDVARTEQAYRTFFTFLRCGNPDDLEAELAAVDAALPLAIIDRGLERSMADEVVRAIPEFALARARRLAERGDLEGTYALLGTIDPASHSLDPQARRDLAHALIALAHQSLDLQYAVIRQWREERASLTEAEDGLTLEAAHELIAQAIVDAMVHLDRVHQAALRALSPSSEAIAPVEALVLSFPFLVRRDHVFIALDRGGAVLPGAGAAAEALSAYAVETPDDGEIAALLAFWKRVAGFTAKARREADKRCEHLGTAPLRDLWCARVERDLSLAENVSSFEPAPEA